MRSHPFAVLCFVLAVVAPAACSDPVRARRIAEQGPEDPRGPSPDHRRGQDCLACHDAEGGDPPELVVAGTVFKDPSANAEGAADVEIQFIDANGGGPLNNPFTLPSGNFYVLRSEWPDITFPFKVRLKSGANFVPMRTTVNREGSCNFCHRPTPAEPLTDEHREIARRSTTQIFLTAGTP